MKILIATAFSLVSATSWSQQDTATHLIPVRPAAYEPHSIIATVALGFIDGYRNDYSVPAGFSKSNTSGFAPILAKLEYGFTNHMSIAGTFGYDKFTYNLAQVYEGNNGSFTRYIANNTRIISGGLTAFYHFRRLLPAYRFDPFLGLGVSINNIRYSKYPQGDSTVVKLDHSVTPYLKAGMRYYASNKFSLYGDVGYDKQAIVSVGISVRFAKNKYLPDSDGDGIPDNVDSCPYQAGLAKFHGCPDSDGDGIPDYADSCPHQKGLAQFHGCPDSDDDGIPDNEDACPYLAGPVKFHGCPDSDGDGVPDLEDSCPHQAGLIQFHGCPDSDGDGIPDNLDACPFKAGPIENHGCPITVVEPQKQIALPISVIQFDFDKAVISKSSLPLLDDVAALLKEHADIGLFIDGYADITGKPVVNKRISLARAQCVKAYLVKKGVAPARLVTRGHGSQSPVASNRTRTGRAKNRRATLKIEDNTAK